MATKSVKSKAKATAKMPVLEKDIQLIRKTAKKINKEVTKTATELLDDVVTNGKELKKLATKTIKEAGKKIDFNDSVEMVRKTTMSVNKEIWKTAEEVTGDVTATGKEMVNVVAKTAKKAIENMDMTDQLDVVKKSAKKINKIALETADEIVEGVFENTEKWQNVAAKAVKGGLKLAGRQQEIVFDTLETVKGQLTNSAIRLRKILTNK